MKISVILLDWSVRESFHSIHYLNDQSWVRSDYELIWIEYFERQVPELEQYHLTGYLDKYLILGNKPGDYNKHAAWNMGVLEASGDIVVLCDSDAIFRRSFIKNIIDFFASHNNSFLLIDEIRSENKAFWPFSYPAWEEVLAAPGVVNWNEQHGVSNGLIPQYIDLPLWEKMFLRNYGACLCVRKSDYIRYGGLDEHDSYTGYICGPYDLAVRMVNGGMQENWHLEEFLLHTYHPWVNPCIDRLGPHFRHNSATSFKHLFDGNTMPYQENKHIRTIRKKMFADSSREGCPRFSVIVPRPYLRFIQRLYDSVKNATRFPFEVIFVGEEDFQADEDHMFYLKYYGSLYTSIIEGFRRAKGEIVVVVPGESIFRSNALDKLLDLQKKLNYPITYLNAIETFSQGFIWQYSSHQFVCDGSVGMMTAFDRNLLSDDVTESGLRKIFCEGKKISSFLETPIHLDIWHNKINIYDEYLEELLTKILDFQYNVSYGDNTLTADKASCLFDQIYCEEKKKPGDFLKYFFLKRYSLREYYSFIVLLRQFNRIDLMIKGLTLITDSTSVLTTNINENIRELIWSYRLLYTDTTQIIGSAHFNLAVHELNHNNIQKAIIHLNSCLVFIPHHQGAKSILAQIL